MLTPRSTAISCNGAGFRQAPVVLVGNSNVGKSAERTALIGQLYARADAQAVAELLLDVTDTDDLVRLRLIAALRELLEGPGARR